MIPHVSFLASEKLYTSAQEYIDLMSSSAQPNPLLLGEVMNNFTHDCLQAFMLRPMEELQITGGQRRLVEFVVDTVEKTTQVVMKATLSRLDMAQHRQTADFVDGLRLRLPHEDRGEAWFVSFEAPSDFSARARSAMARAREQGPEAELREIILVMKVLTDLALYNYYERPLAILKFGPILRKVSEVAVGTVRKGTYSTIESLLPKLSEEQLIKGIDYFDSLLVDVPRDRLRPAGRTAG